MATTSLRKTSTSALSRINNNMKACAKAVNLQYISDNYKGISRVKKHNQFLYYCDNKRITDAGSLKRIKSLVIPPAWTDVWISADERGHLQATGKDIKNIKQYRYHPNWNQLRNHAKFSNLLEFGKTLPHIRNHIEKDISQKDICETKVIALVLSIMEKTYIRVGNSYYEKMNGSHGLTTLKDKHVVLNGNSIQFFFVGKKSVSHEITIKNKKLARLVKECRDIPGKELFQYLSDDGSRKRIESGMVNNYIKKVSQKQFTTKDFRTWAGSVNALEKIIEIQKSGTELPKKTRLNEIIDFVSKRLGNTRAVCKKYYIHPYILDLFAHDKLPAINKSGIKTEGLTETENWMMEILKSHVKQENVIVNKLICV